MTKQYKKTHSVPVKKTHSGKVKKTVSINEIDEIGSLRIIYEIINNESFQNNQILTNDPRFFEVTDCDFLKLASSVFFELIPKFSRT